MYVIAHKRRGYEALACVVPAASPCFF